MEIRARHHVIARFSDRVTTQTEFEETLGQRLVKKLCDCKQAYQPSPQEIKDFIKAYAEELRHTEAWQLDAAKKLIQERARVAELFACAVNSGMRTLKMDGMEKVLMGLTDLKQVRPVCIK